MRPLDTFRAVIPWLVALFSFACGGSDQTGIEANPATTIGIDRGNNQVGSPGSPVVTHPSVKVTDANAKPVADVPVSFAVTAGGGSITGGNPKTNTSGIAAVGSWTLGPAAGSNTLTATAAGLSGSPVTFTAMADTAKGPYDY